jgi:hypothetical protein
MRGPINASDVNRIYRVRTLLVKLRFLLLLLAPAALAQRLTVNPDTQLSLDFSVQQGTSCILVPEKSYDPKACEGIPPEDTSSAQRTGQGVRALVFVTQAGHAFIVTVASIPRPGIGQLYDQDIQGFIEGTLRQLSGQLGAPTRSLSSQGKLYTVEQVSGVPVVRWEYMTDLPDTDPRSGTASAVAYLIPSRDTLDILSIHTPPRGLEAARDVGKQLISTLRVPLTIDAEKFGTDLWWALELKLLAGGVALAGVGVAGVWLWRKRARGRGEKKERKIR